MPLETECEIKLTKEGESIIDAWRAKLLVRISETGSLERSTKDMGISMQEAKTWLALMQGSIGAPPISYGPDGTQALTDGGQALLTEYETRSRMAREQVRNLWKKSWVTTDGIVVIDDQVVLIKRGREPFKGMYALPGGIVEYGEPVEDGMVREFEEETGIKTRVLDLVGVYSAVDRDPRGHFITLAFNLQPIGGELRGGDDAAEARMFPLDQLPEMASDHRKILIDALNRRGRYGPQPTTLP